MRVRHHHFTHLNIHKDWSRSVFRKYGKFQKFITSLFLIRFSWFLHHFVWNNFLFLIKICYFWRGLPLFIKSLSSPCLASRLTLILPGYLRHLSPPGGGLFWPPLQISATDRAIAAKICTKVETNILYKTV